MRPRVSRLGYACARSRLLRDESGIALIMAIGIMLVLTIVLTTVISLTAASARDAQRTNAGQKAYALAEAGINNALAVLNANYPAATFPGDYTLLTGNGPGEAQCPCTSTYSNGTAVWTGALAAAPATAFWKYEWQLTGTGSVRNPTGPGAANVTRITRAVVPVVIPDQTSVDPAKSSLNWVYGYNDVTFGQSVIVASPVFAGRDLELQNTATISETIPAVAGIPARPNSVAVVRNVWQKNTGAGQNHIGHVNGTADPPPFPGNDLGDAHVGGKCGTGGNKPALPTDPSYHTCVPGTNAAKGDWIFANVFNNTTTGLLIPPTFTCCASGDPSRPISYAAPVDGTSHPGSPSDVGFWYINADLGPHSPCATYTSTGYPVNGSSELRFDNPSAIPTAFGADEIINQSSTAGTNPFNLTPSGVKYDCRSVNGKQLSWNGTTSSWNGIPAKTLKINGTIFIDGSVTSTADPATYLGQGAIILSGTFQMLNHNELCVHTDGGSNCDPSQVWDPNLAGMFIFAAGDFNTDRSNQQTSTLMGESIDVKQAQYQGGLFAAKDISANVSGTLVEGPMVSTYGNVSAGQSGTLSFPPISFPSSGTDGFTGPLPKAHLLAPRQFGGG